MTVKIEYDTVTKKMTITEDGAAMAAVDYVNFYPCYDRKGEYHMEITQSARSEEAGVTKRISTIAKALGYIDEN